MHGSGRPTSFLIVVGGDASKEAQDAIATCGARSELFRQDGTVALADPRVNPLHVQAFKSMRKTFEGRSRALRPIASVLIKPDWPRAVLGELESTCILIYSTMLGASRVLDSVVIVSFLNQEGGVGKPTLAVHLATVLAEYSWVLLVGADPKRPPLTGRLSV